MLDVFIMNINKRKCSPTIQLFVMILFPHESLNIPMADLSGSPDHASEDVARRTLKFILKLDGKQTPGVSSIKCSVAISVNEITGKSYFISWWFPRSSN